MKIDYSNLGKINQVLEEYNRIIGSSTFNLFFDDWREAWIRRDGFLLGADYTRDVINKKLQSPNYLHAVGNRTKLYFTIDIYYNESRKELDNLIKENKKYIEQAFQAMEKHHD